MPRVFLVRGESLVDEAIRQALDALTSQTQRAGDCGHRRRLLLDRLEDEPARERLARRLR